MNAAREALREQLRSELATLIARHQKIGDHLHNADRDVPSDWPDRAQLFENDTVLEALDGRTRTRIAQIELALNRLGEPDWGTCARCGDAIPPARLAALPTTMVCRGCAEATMG